MSYTIHYMDNLSRPQNMAKKGLILVPRAGIEPATTPSSGECSTTELPRQDYFGNVFKTS